VKNFLQHILLLVSLFLNFGLVAQPQKPTEKTEKKEESTITAKEKKEVSLLKLNYSIGRFFFQGEGGMTMGLQLGVAPFRMTPLYIGLGGDFAFVSENQTTSITNITTGGWYEFSPIVPGIAPFLGFGGGIGFVSRDGTPPPTQFPFLPLRFSVFYVDAGISTFISDVAVVRAQVRPGVTNGRFILKLNANIQFRFL